MFVTTYQHDYVPPRFRKYGFFMPVPRFRTYDVSADCNYSPPVPKPRPPIDHTSEWTRVAPMGRLMKPILRPISLKPEEIDELIAEDKPVESTPVEVKPNDFLTDLRRGFPNLYQRLDLMALNAANRRPVWPVNETNYQAAYNAKVDVPGSGYLMPLVRKRAPVERLEPCDEYRMNILNDLQLGLVDIHPCDPPLPNFDKFIKQGKYVGASTGTAWPARTFTTRPNYTEYKDTIHKVGCVIMKNNLHDHSLCENGRFCRHPIIHKCRRLK